MIQRMAKWMWTRRWRMLGLFLLVAFLFLNVMDYLHARAMTHFAPGGSISHHPEKLSVMEKGTVLLTGVTIFRPVNPSQSQSVGLPFTTHHLTTKDGTELESWLVPHPWARGSVMMFHGCAACRCSLLAEAREFHDMGWTVLLVDFRRSGGSSGAKTTIGVLEAVDVDASLTHAETAGLAALYANLGNDREIELFAEVGHESLQRARPDQWRRAVEGFLHRLDLSR